VTRVPQCSRPNLPARLEIALITGWYFEATYPEHHTWLFTRTKIMIATYPYNSPLASAVNNARSVPTPVLCSAMFLLLWCCYQS
jgi:hypothetical protein